MKNIVKNILITGVVLCGTGIVLYGAGNLLGGKEYVKAANLNRLDGTAMRGEPDGVKQMEKTKIDDFEKLDVDFNDIDFNIKPSDDENYYLEYTLEGDEGGTPKENPFTYEKMGDTLKMREKGGATSSSYMKIDIGVLSDILGEESIQEYKNEVTLYVPADQNISGTIKMGDGELDAKAVKIDGMEVTMEYGDVTLEGVKMKDSKVTTDDGDLELNVAAFEGTNKIHTAYGDIETSFTEADAATLNIECSTKYGGLDIAEELKGNMRVSDDESTYEKTGDKSAGKLEITTSDGDISVK